MFERFQVAETSGQQRIVGLEQSVRSVSLLEVCVVSSLVLVDGHFVPARFAVQLEQERLDLRSQMSLLRESKEAVEVELKVRSATHVQNAEEAAQQRAEANALRSASSQHLLQTHHSKRAWRPTDASLGPQAASGADGPVAVRLAAQTVGEDERAVRRPRAHREAGRGNR